MLDSVFGEGHIAFKVVFALIVVIGLLALAFWALRRFGGDRLGSTASRGRQPRLAVIDAAHVDGRRRLVLIRRDNIEHLLMIGGPSDVVIEQNIVRAAAAPREAPPVRPPAAPEAQPRAAPLHEGSMWPLQPEPAARMEPTRVEPPRMEPLRPVEPRMEPRVETRPQRVPPPALPPEPQELEEWAEEPEVLPTPAPTRERARPRAVDPLAGLAEELGRAPAPPAVPEPAPEPPLRQIEPHMRQAEPPVRMPPRRPPRPQPQAQPQPVPAPAVAPAPAAEAEISAAADQNLAEMAQRLEAALRRPTKADGGRPANEPAQRSAAESQDEPKEPTPSAPPPRPAAIPAGPRPVRPARVEARPAAPQKSLYDSLEQEMASLLGRPNEKT